MDYKTLLVNEIPNGLEVVFNRLEKRNTINSAFIAELSHVIELAEKNPKCRLIVLKGQKGIFCCGMDFEERIQKTPETAENPAALMNLLKKICSTSKVVISIVDGQVIAGGVGFVAASDYVISTTKSEFSLSEALWGLLPANILPFIIRRVGFQKAYTMTLTTRKVSAMDACAISLVDEVSDEPEKALKKLSTNLLRVSEDTVYDLKKYFRKLWIINEEMEQTAINELESLVHQPRVQTNIKNFVEKGIFPWDNQ